MIMGLGELMNQPSISIIIPVYNEEQSLAPLFERLQNSLDGLAQSYELIFVDDGSTDYSLEIMQGFVNQRPQQVVVVEQVSNLGKSAALMVGFAIARGDVLFTMDADLQDDPDEIPTLLAKLDEGYDLVTGLRSNRGNNDPIGKTFPSKVANRLTRTLSGVPLRDMNSGFKCYRREVVKTVKLHSDLHRYIPVLAYYHGFKVTEVPIKHHPRQYGCSKYGAGRFIRSLFDLVTVLFLSRYRYRPLHMFGTVGLLFAGSGLLISFYLSLVWLFTDNPIGSRPLLMLGVLLIITGTQFILMGLVADLIVSIERNREDPTSTVRRVHRGREYEEQPYVEKD